MMTTKIPSFVNTIYDYREATVQNIIEVLQQEGIYLIKNMPTISGKEIPYPTAIRADFKVPGTICERGQITTSINTAQYKQQALEIAERVKEFNASIVYFTQDVVKREDGDGEPDTSVFLYTIWFYTLERLNE